MNDDDRGRHVRLVFAACQCFAALLLVCFIVGSLLFTGGRIGESQSANWPELWDWPVFAVPAWLMVTPAVVAALVVVPVASRTPARRAALLLGAIGQTAAAAASAVAFMILMPASEGPISHPIGEGALGLHWAALPFDAFCAVVLVVALVRKGPEYERRRIAGDDVG